MTEYIQINQSVLNWIQSTIQISDLPETMQDQFRSWHDESKGATKHQIQDFSNNTHIPFGYFFRKQPPGEEFSFSQFTTAGTRKLTHPSRELIDTCKNMAEIKDWMSEYLEKKTINTNALAGKFNQKSEFSSQKVIAAYARNILDPEKTLIGKGKRSEELFAEFRKVLSDEGILVMTSTCVKNNPGRQLDPNEFRGIALMDKYSPLIFINQNDSPSGQLFTLLREFVCILTGMSDLYTDSDDQTAQQMVNAIAAEILLPDEQLLERWDFSKNSSEAISEITRIFSISSEAAARKAFDNNLINAETYISVSTENKKPSSNPMPDSSTSPDADICTRTRSKFIYDHRFLKCLNVSLEEGETTCTDLYSMTGLNIQAFQALMDDVEKLS